jgi:hypothetical protein
VQLSQHTLPWPFDALVQTHSSKTEYRKSCVLRSMRLDCELMRIGRVTQGPSLRLNNRHFMELITVGRPHSWLLCDAVHVGESKAQLCG